MASTLHPIATRDIIYEPTFILSSFRGEPFCAGALKVLNVPGLRPLFNPPERAYPRVVRAFYETFAISTDEDGNNFFSVAIDDAEFTFSFADIADALGIPHYRPLIYDVPNNQMCNELNLRPTKADDGHKVRTSYLHEDMWLVDEFVYSVLCPIIHAHERPQYVWKYWHGLLKRRGLDVPALMMDVVDRVRTGGRRNTVPHKLAYPRFITAILEHLEYVFSPDEEVISSDFPVLNYATVSKSLSKLAKIAGLTPPTPKRQRGFSLRPERGEGSGTAHGAAEDSDEEEQARPQPAAAPTPPVSRTIQQPHLVSQAEFKAWGDFQRRTTAWMATQDHYQEESHRQLDDCYGRIDQCYDLVEQATHDIAELSLRQDDFAYRQAEMYHMQRRSIEMQMGTDSQRLFDEARDFAASSRDTYRTEAEARSATRADERARARELRALERAQRAQRRSRRDRE